MGTGRLVEAGSEGGRLSPSPQGTPVRRNQSYMGEQVAQGTPEATLRSRMAAKTGPFQTYFYSLVRMRSKAAWQGRERGRKS